MCLACTMHFTTWRTCLLLAHALTNGRADSIAKQSTGLITLLTANLNISDAAQMQMLCRLILWTLFTLLYTLTDTAVTAAVRAAFVANTFAGGAYKVGFRTALLCFPLLCVVFDPRYAHCKDWGDSPTAAVGAAYTCIVIVFFAQALFTGRWSQVQTRGSKGVSPAQTRVQTEMDLSVLTTSDYLEQIAEVWSTVWTCFAHSCLQIFPHFFFSALFAAACPLVPALSCFLMWMSVRYFLRRIVRSYRRTSSVLYTHAVVYQLQNLLTHSACAIVVFVNCTLASVFTAEDIAKALTPSVSGTPSDVVPVLSTPDTSLQTAPQQTPQIPEPSVENIGSLKKLWRRKPAANPPVVNTGFVPQVCSLLCFISHIMSISVTDTPRTGNYHSTVPQERCSSGNHHSGKQLPWNCHVCT
jgi:hypothetical protein